MYGWCLRREWVESEWIRRQGRVKQNARDTLKPNLSGNSAKRRVSRELLPTPEGPEMTRGRRKSVKGDMGNGGDEECGERATCQLAATENLKLEAKTGAGSGGAIDMRRGVGGSWATGPWEGRLCLGDCDRVVV